MDQATLLTDALPLVVDLDDTLLATDSLHEQIVRRLFLNPVGALLDLRHLARGRAAFKEAMAAGDDCPELPVRQDVLAWLRECAANGREVHLCTAAHHRVADAVARRLGIFSSVAGSRDINLKGVAKADHLAECFPGGFVYAGDSAADIAVWRRASGIVLVGAGAATERAARALGKPIERVFTVPRARAADWIAAARVHHWTKNALVVIPFVLGHGWTDPSVLPRMLAGFVALLTVVSSTYMINDLADLDSDRAHWSKCRRPIPSGRIKILHALVAGACGIAAGLALAVLLSLPFAAGLLCYLVITLAYSFGLKRVPLLDTAIIGFLFTLRLIMGTALAGQRYSQWLLAFSMFFFFCLATAKRQTELLRSVSKGGAGARGYRAEDSQLLASIGMGAGMSSLVILCLYLTTDPEQKILYARPGYLWVAPLIVGIWIGRVWLLAQRGEMNDDPVSFAIRDKVSLGLGVSLLAAFLLAL